MYRMILKITKKELQSVNEEPLELFYQGIKSPITKQKYVQRLRKILCEFLEDILDGSFEERVTQFVQKAKKDPDWALSILLTLSKKLRQRTELEPSNKNYLNPTTLPNFFKPIRKLCEMNDIPIVWKRVQSTFPEIENSNESRGYTRQEIQKMLAFANGPMERSIILVAASSGIRVGGFDLKWKDLIPVYQIDNKIVLDITESESKKAQIICAILIVYRNSKHEYPAFITPEAYNSIMDYKSTWIKEVEREPKPDDPLFKQAGVFLKSIKADSIKRRITRTAERAGIRKPLVKGKRMYEIPVMNGFRRFFNKTNKETLSKDSPLASLIKKEYMMEHTGLIPLDRNYFKTHIVELIEEYLNAVPNLTISDELRLKAEKLKILKDRNQLQVANKEIHHQYLDRIEELEKTVGRLVRKIERQNKIKTTHESKKN